MSDSNAVYLIEKVLEYHPNRGYLVQWKDFQESENTWQKASAMPGGFRQEMRHARIRFQGSECHSVPNHGHSNNKQTDLTSSESRGDGVKQPDSPKEGQEYWIINQVLDYDPMKGFLVSWLGCDSDEDSWQREREMPDGCRDGMKAAKRIYRTRNKKENAKLPNKPAGAIIPRPKAPIGTKLTKTKQIVRAIEKFSRPRGPKIHSILAFAPEKGYLVHWKDTKSTHDSWVFESDIPAGTDLQGQMRLAVERFNDDLAVTVA